MFDWVRRILKPVATTRSLGRLKLRSGTLVVGDPQYLPAVEIPNVAAGEAEISASFWTYSTGAVTIAVLSIGLGESPGHGEHRQVGEVGVDSAKLVVVDKRDFEEHWTDTGKDLIGVISRAPDDSVLRLLTKQFNLQTVPVNQVRAELIGPVSEELEAEIEHFLKADPRYAAYPFMYFRVQTNNSFDRANYMSHAWEFMPVGNSSKPLMFVCQTGRGDGCYDVYAEFIGDVPQSLTVTFIDG